MDAPSYFYKKVVISFLFILFSSLTAYSQPSISLDNFKSIFDPASAHYSTEVFEGQINIGKPGGPNVYDFTGIDIQNLFMSHSYSVSQIPLLLNRYPHDAVTIGESEETIENNPVFIFRNDTAYSIGQATVSPEVRFVHYRPYDIIGVFPLVYGSVISQQIEMFDTLFDANGQATSIDYSSSNEVTTVDGYGTLKLKGREYECMRIKKEHNAYGDKEFIYLTREGALLLVGGISLSAPDSGSVMGAFEVMFPQSLVGINDENITLDSYSLSQNFPNPFNPETVIAFSVPEENLVTIKLYDILGNEIMELVNEIKPKGHYKIKFEGRNLASGIYFYHLISGNYSSTKKMVLLR